MQIQYRGPVRGLHMLAGELRKAGYDVDFDQPQERRGGTEQEAVAAIIAVVVTKASDATIAGAKRIVTAFRERYPQVKAEVGDAGDPRGYL